MITEVVFIGHVIAAHGQVTFVGCEPAGKVMEECGASALV